jgi:hypothetical protein
MRLPAIGDGKAAVLVCAAIASDVSSLVTSIHGRPADPVTALSASLQIAFWGRSAAPRGAQTDRALLDSTSPAETGLSEARKILPAGVKSKL